VVNPVSVFYNGLFLHSFNEKNTGATTPERQHGDWGRRRRKRKGDKKKKDRRKERGKEE
jgi:hypothetical protein